MNKKQPLNKAKQRSLQGVVPILGTAIFSFSAYTSADEITHVVSQIDNSTYVFKNDDHYKIQGIVKKDNFSNENNPIPGPSFYSGGPLQVIDNASLDIFNNTFTVSAEFLQKKAVVYVDKELTINSTSAQRFQNNMVIACSDREEQKGGALFVGNDVSITSPFISFIGNKALGKNTYGGAIYTDGKEITIKGSALFKDNIATYGGAIAYGLATDPHTLNLNPCNENDSIVFASTTDNIYSREKPLTINIKGSGKVITNAYNTNLNVDKLDVKGATLQLGANQTHEQPYFEKVKNFSLSDNAHLAFYANESVTDNTPYLVLDNNASVNIADNTSIYAIIGHNKNAVATQGQKHRYLLIKNANPNLSDSVTLDTNNALYALVHAENTGNDFYVDLVKKSVNHDSIDAPMSLYKQINAMEESNSWIDSLYSKNSQGVETYNYNDRSLIANSATQLSRLSAGFEIAHLIAKSSMTYMTGVYDSNHYGRHVHYVTHKIPIAYKNFDKRVKPFAKNNKKPKTKIKNRYKNVVVAMIRPYASMWTSPFYSTSKLHNQKGGYGIKTHQRASIYGSILGASYTFGEGNTHRVGMQLIAGSADARNIDSFVVTKNNAKFYGGLVFSQWLVDPRLLVSGYFGTYFTNDDVTQNGMGRLSAKYKANLMDIGVNSTYIIPLKRGRHPWLLTANIGIDVQNYNQGGFDTNYTNNGDQYFDGINEKAMKSKKWNATLISLPIAFDLNHKFVITREDNFFTSISLGYTPIFGKRKQETKVQLVNSNTDSSIPGANLVDRQNANVKFKVLWQHKKMNVSVFYDTDFSVHHFAQAIGADLTYAF